MIYVFYAMALVFVPSVRRKHLLAESTLLLRLLCLFHRPVEVLCVVVQRFGREQTF